MLKESTGEYVVSHCLLSFKHFREKLAIIFIFNFFLSSEPTFNVFVSLLSRIFLSEGIFRVRLVGVRFFMFIKGCFW